MKHLNDHELLNELKRLVQIERETTLEVLHYLREVESRRLFAECSFSSMHDYCTKELKYSSAAAYRRIEAMRLLKDCPEVESRVASGELNLTTLASAQTYFKEKKPSK